MTNCEMILPLLHEYLKGSLPPEQRRAVQAHVLSCRSCQAELAEQKLLRQRLKASFYLQAQSAAPSAQIWYRILSRLQAESQRSAVPPSWISRKLGWSWVLSVGLLFLLGLPVLLSPGRRLATPALIPAYLPSKEMVVTIEAQGSPALIRSYHQGDEFITILQQPAPSGTPLPPGKEVDVQGHNAALQTSRPEYITYNLPSRQMRRTVNLTWYTGRYQVQVLSNLPEKEVIKVAESLFPQP